MKKLTYNNIEVFYEKNKQIIIPAAILVGIIILLFVIVKTKNQSISFAKKFLGQEETGNNQGFYSPKLETLMRSVGWKPGYQWCAFFTKLVWTNSLKPKHRERAKKLMNGSTQLTLKNFENDSSGLFKVSNTPKKGAMVIWRSKTDPTRGHTGIVEKSKITGEFETIEGNSNKGGSPGIITRLKYAKGGSPKGLKQMAFIIPV